jgi:hypothetical protein
MAGAGETFEFLIFTPGLAGPHLALDRDSGERGSRFAVRAGGHFVARFIPRRAR